jgi:hypothetical protein
MKQAVNVFWDSSVVSQARDVFPRVTCAMERTTAQTGRTREIAVRELYDSRHHLTDARVGIKIKLNIFILNQLDFCENEFYCPSGKCVSWTSTCNDLWDCVDGSDEPNVCKKSKTGLTGMNPASDIYTPRSQWVQTLW